MNMEGFGARLRAARLAKGLFQADVAKQLCISRSAYTKYEIEAAQPSLDALCQLADLLDVTTSFLLGQD